MSYDCSKPPNYPQDKVEVEYDVSKPPEWHNGRDLSQLHNSDLLQRLAEVEKARQAAHQVAGAQQLYTSSNNNIRDLVRQGYAVSAEITPELARLFLPSSAYKTVGELVLVRQRWQPLLEQYIQFKVGQIRKTVADAVSTGNVTPMEEELTLHALGGPNA